MKHRGENENEGGKLRQKTRAFEGNSGYSGQEEACRRWKNKKKRDRERGKQPSDETPVMSTQVLMRAAAPVDAPLGDKPTTGKQRGANRKRYSPRKGGLIKEAVPTKLQDSH